VETVGDLFLGGEREREDRVSRGGRKVEKRGERWDERRSRFSALAET